MLSAFTGWAFSMAVAGASAFSPAPSPWASSSIPSPPPQQYIRLWRRWCSSCISGYPRGWQVPLKGVPRQYVGCIIIDAATPPPLLCLLLLPRHGWPAIFSPSPPPSLPNFRPQCRAAYPGREIPAPAALLLLTAAAAVGAGGCASIFGGCCPDRQPLILAGVSLACYGAALLLCGHCGGSELSWLSLLLRGEKIPKHEFKIFREKTEKSGVFQKFIMGSAKRREIF